MFDKKSLSTYQDVNALAEIIGEEGIKAIINNKALTTYTWYGKLILGAVEFANNHRVVLASVNDGNNAYEEYIDLNLTIGGYIEPTYYHTMVGHLSASALLSHDYELFTKVMKVASEALTERVSNLNNLQGLK